MHYALPILIDVLAYLPFRIVCKIVESSIKHVPRRHISVSTQESLFFSFLGVLSTYASGSSSLSLSESRDTSSPRLILSIRDLSFSYHRYLLFPS
jgi:hypothetical protein